MKHEEKPVIFAGGIDEIRSVANFCRIKGLPCTFVLTDYREIATVLNVLRDASIETVTTISLLLTPKPIINEDKEILDPFFDSADEIAEISALPAAKPPKAHAPAAPKASPAVSKASPAAPKPPASPKTPPAPKVAATKPRSEYRKDYDLKNKEKIKEYYRLYYQKNKEKLKACSRKHHQEKRDKAEKIGTP